MKSLERARGPRRAGRRLVLMSAPAPFDRDGWVFELKYDGFRMLAAHRSGQAELVSRRGNHFADRFPEITAQLLGLPDVRARR